MSDFAITPKPPYFLVAFSSKKQNIDSQYKKTSEAMMKLVINYYNCLGVETVSNSEGFSITNSYWNSLDDIKNWKNDKEHILAQKEGIKKWYKNYYVRISEVTKDYSNINL